MLVYYEDKYTVSIQELGLGEARDSREDSHVDGHTYSGETCQMGFYNTPIAK